MTERVVRPAAGPLSGRRWLRWGCGSDDVDCGAAAVTRHCRLCRTLIAALRSTRIYCSGACRTAAYRHRIALGPVKLRQCRVEPISSRVGGPFIKAHEHLGTVGGCRWYFGLRCPGGRLLGVVGFGRGAHAGGRGADAVLERGACLPGAPRNAASFLIGRALRYGRRVLGWATIRAYSDPRFGEEGLVYRAAGFVRCAPSRHGWGWRYALVTAGRVLSDRAIYRRFGSHAAARAAGAAIVRLPARIAWEAAL